MIRFPSISFNPPQLPTREQLAPKQCRQPHDRLSLGQEVGESEHTDNRKFLKALSHNFGEHKPHKSDSQGLKNLLESRKDIKRSDLLGRDSQPLTCWSDEHFKLLMANPLMRPADLKDVDPAQLEVIKQRPELHPQELPEMDRQIADVLGPLLGGRGASHCLPLIRQSCFDLLTRRADLRPETMVDLMKKMATAAAGVGLRNEGPDMFLKATETMARRPDLGPEQLAKVAQDMRQRVFYDGQAGLQQDAFSHCMELLQKRNSLDVEQISEQMQGLDEQPARRAGPSHRARFFHNRLRRLAGESSPQVRAFGAGTTAA
ncbi:hypothetical protein JST97_20790 [bacterium]|nr:hypothetical protein [bacterium]